MAVELVGEKAVRMVGEKGDETDWMTDGSRVVCLAGWRDALWGERWVRRKALTKVCSGAAEKVESTVERLAFYMAETKAEM